MHNTDFGREEYHDLENDTITYRDIPLKEIIRSVVQTFGREQAQNIIINDLDEAGMELMEYRGLEPLYLYRDMYSSDFKNIITDKNQECFYILPQVLSLESYKLIPEVYNFLLPWYVWDNTEEAYLFDNRGDELPVDYFISYDEKLWFKGSVGDEFSIIYDDMVDGMDKEIYPTIIKFGLNDSENPYKSECYYLAKCNYGDLVGYKLTDLTYCNSGNSNTQELIGKAGETLTSILDKIKNMLVHFEYFYDINGKFVFQKMENQIISPWNSSEIDSTQKLQFNAIDKDVYTFNFANGKLVTSYANNPKLLELKNDYSIWGSYQSNGNDIPIHMRYAIDVKPVSYQPIRPLKEEIVTRIIDSENRILDEQVTYKYYDAPEAEPYNDENLLKLEDGQTQYCFEVTNITINLPNGNKRQTITYPYFATSPYTTEILDWRELIYQMALDHRKCGYVDDFLYYIAETNPQYPSGYTGYEQYYVDILGAVTDGGWRSLYNPNAEKIFNDISPLDVQSMEVDNVYISRPYRTLTYSDLETLTYDQLYVFSSPFDATTATQSPFVFIYPFANSDVGNLELYKTYFLVKEGKWQSQSASLDLQTVEGEANYEAYKTLNNTSLQNIYVKNMQLFQVTPSDYGGPEYRVIVNEGADDGLTQEVMVPYFDMSSNLDTYQNSEQQDYILAIESKFNNVLEQLKILNRLLYLMPIIQQNPVISYEDYNKLLSVYEDRDYIINLFEINPEEATYTGDINELNSIIHYLQEKYYKYCVKDNSYIKYTELDEQFKPLYYKSNFDIFYFLAYNLLNTINNLKISDIAIEKLSYLNDICNNINAYATEIFQYRESDLINNINDELQFALSEYYYTLLEGLDSWLWLNNLTDNDADWCSCLPQLFSDLKTHITREYTSIESSDNITYTRILTAITNIHGYFQTTIREIESNYNDNRIILKTKKDLDSLEDKSATNVKSLFQGTYDVLNGQTTKLEQTKKCIAILSQLIATLTMYEAESGMTEDEVSQGVMNIMYTFDDSVYNAILALKNFLGIVEDEDIPEGVSKDEYDAPIQDYSLTYLVNALKNTYTDFFNFVEKTMDLKSLVTIEITDREALREYLQYEKPLQSETGLTMPTIYNYLGTIPEDSISSEFESYIKSKEGFQTFLFTENVNRFNHYPMYVEEETLKTNKSLLREKIYYYNISYNHSRDYETGDFWAKNIFLEPQYLTFWFDFLEPDTSDLAKYSVPVIGNRTKVINNDKNIRAIHYKEIPQVIFRRSSDDDNFERKSGYTYIFISSAAEGLFNISSKGKSAKEKIDELLNQYSYCTEDINMSVIPVYHLQPNDHIYVRDDKSNINGEYVINKLTIPLGYNKTMSISATKIIPNIA